MDNVMVILVEWSEPHDLKYQERWPALAPGMGWSLLSHVPITITYHDQRQRVASC
jgi:hypothetical protein